MGRTANNDLLFVCHAADPLRRTSIDYNAICLQSEDYRSQAPHEGYFGADELKGVAQTTQGIRRGGQIG